jgi:hypothetical protein
MMASPVREAIDTAFAHDDEFWTRGFASFADRP